MPFDDSQTYYSYNDLLVLPDGPCDFFHKDIKTETKLTKRITLNIPILSAAMDTVTETRMAIEMAILGGAGVIHKNFSIEEQARKIAIVKRWTQYLIPDPVTVHPEMPLNEFMAFQKISTYSSFPVVDENNILVGIVTKKDYAYRDENGQKIKDIMTKKDLVTAKKSIKPDKAKKLLETAKKEKLLIVNKKGQLDGLITMKDLQLGKTYPNVCLDSSERLVVFGAVGVGGDAEKRAAALVKAGANGICIDAAHGWSVLGKATLKMIHDNHPDIDIIVGNFGTKKAIEDIAKMGLDSERIIVKIGIGPGGICTTRIVSGVGVPQGSAIIECIEAAIEAGYSLIADGGIVFSGDITKAIALGAHAVMLGGLLAGAEESPGEKINIDGHYWKVYEGMGSFNALKRGEENRYTEGEKIPVEQMISQGLSKKVPYVGLLKNKIFQLIGGLKEGMKYTNNRTIRELREESRVVKITPNSYLEGHVHGIGTIAQGEANYPVSNSKGG